MSKPVVEKIEQWIADTLDGVSDTESLITLNSVRSNILDWDVSSYAHGDILIDIVSIETLQKDYEVERKEKVIFKLCLIIRKLGDNSADTLLNQGAELIRQTLLADADRERVCGSMAESIECLAIMFGMDDGCVIAEVTVEIEYYTDIKDGFVLRR